MKIRKGFVSNSSSSSFLINYREWDGDILLTEEDVKLLLANGFHPTTKTGVSQVYYDENDIRFVKREDMLSLYKSVTCNQDDIIYFLLKNNISFSALCHYGTEWIFYTKNDKTFLKINDFGKYKEIYGKLPYTDTHMSNEDVKTFIEENQELINERETYI